MPFVLMWVWISVVLLLALNFGPVQILSTTLCSVRKSGAVPFTKRESYSKCLFLCAKYHNGQICQGGFVSGLGFKAKSSEFGVVSRLVGWFVGLIEKNYETIGL